MLGAAPAKKMLGAALEKNMLQTALGKKLCLGRLQLKKTAGSCVR